MTSPNKDFQAGARAMFDALVARAANNFHGNPKINALCDKENALVMEWVEDALEEVDPQSCYTWRDITALNADLREARAEIQTLKAALEAKTDA